MQADKENGLSVLTTHKNKVIGLCIVGNVEEKPDNKYYKIENHKLSKIKENPRLYNYNGKKFKISLYRFLKSKLKIFFIRVKSLKPIKLLFNYIFKILKFIIIYIISPILLSFISTIAIKKIYSIDFLNYKIPNNDLININITIFLAFLTLIGIIQTINHNRKLSRESQKNQFKPILSLEVTKPKDPMRSYHGENIYIASVNDDTVGSVRELEFDFDIINKGSGPVFKLYFLTNDYKVFMPNFENNIPVNEKMEFGVHFSSGNPDVPYNAFAYLIFRDTINNLILYRIHFNIYGSNKSLQKSVKAYEIQDRKLKRKFERLVRNL